MDESDYPHFLQNCEVDWDEIYRGHLSNYYALPVQKLRELGSYFLIYLQFSFFILYFVFIFYLKKLNKITDFCLSDTNKFE